MFAGLSQTQHTDLLEKMRSILGINMQKHKITHEEVCVLFCIRGLRTHYTILKLYSISESHVIKHMLTILRE